MNGLRDPGFSYKKILLVFFPPLKRENGPSQQCEIALQAKRSSRRAEAHRVFEFPRQQVALRRDWHLDETRGSSLSSTKKREIRAAATTKTANNGSIGCHRECWTNVLFGSHSLRKVGACVGGSGEIRRGCAKRTRELLACKAKNGMRVHPRAYSIVEEIDLRLERKAKLAAEVAREAN